MTSAYLSHIGYSVGVQRPVEALQEKESISPEGIETFRQRGLRGYREDTRSVPEMCMASALQTLDTAGLRPEDIDSVLFASSNSDVLVEDDDETALFAAMRETGFERGRILGLTLQACSAVGDALKVAGALAEEPDASPILVVVFGQKKKTSRLGPQANLVFSDGAASCLVSAREGAFKICASEGITNTRLGEMGRGGSIAQFQGGLVELREVTQSVCRAAGVSTDEIRAFFGTNAGVGHLHLMAHAAGVPEGRIYEDDVAGYSHVHSCDNLISLRHYSEKNELAPGDVFLLLSWSPHVVSGATIRYCG
jgi:3-oxoacyl-[acyl-carrier-protein] synthase III